MIVEKFGGAFLGILAGSAVIRMFYEILNYVIFLKNTGKGKQMEDIIEEFGSGFSDNYQNDFFSWLLV